MKHLKKFSTANEYDAFVASSQFVKPNVSYIVDDGSIHYHRNTSIYIQHTNGNLYTTEQWTAEGFTNDDAKGIAVIAAETQFLITKFSSTNLSWGADGVIDGIVVTTDSSVAKTDYKGKSNTQLMLNAGSAAGNAAFTCNYFELADGQRGYLPSLGELYIAYENRVAINEARSLIGLAAITSQIWSSTQYSADMAWAINWSTGGIINGSRGSNKWRIYAFAEV